MFVVIEFEHGSRIDDGFCFLGAFADLVDGDEYLFFDLVVVDANEVAEVWARHGVEHDGVVRDGGQDCILHDGKVIDDHASMVGASAFVFRGFKFVAVEGTDGEFRSVILAASNFIVDRLHLAVDGNLDLSQHSV